MSALPVKTAISDTYPLPSNATARTGFGALWDAINEFTEKSEVDIASAATCSIGAALSTKLRITGTTGITSLGTTYRGPIMLRMGSSGVVFTHNATSLRCPGGVNYTSAAGDVFIASPIASVSGTYDGWELMTLIGHHALSGSDSLVIPGPSPLVQNLKLTVNASVNKLDVFSKSGGAVPDATNVIAVTIPDGTGNVVRSRAATYLSGTSQFILADATNYWSNGSIDAVLKKAYVYAIWDGTGIVWALGGDPGLTVVTTTTTVTDWNYLLLEASSSYARSTSHYLQCVGQISFQYDTADTPDYTIQATVAESPRVVNPVRMPPGSVLQVVQGTTSTEVTMASTTYTDTTLTAAITPKFASSKILVMVSQSAGAVQTNIRAGGGFRLLRGATVLLTSVEEANGPFDFYIQATGATATQIYSRQIINYLDSPATTSATTYKTQIAAYVGSTVYAQPGAATQNGASTIILMEIAG